MRRAGNPALLLPRCSASPTGFLDRRQFRQIALLQMFREQLPPPRFLFQVIVSSDAIAVRAVEMSGRGKNRGKLRFLKTNVEQFLLRIIIGGV